MRAVFFGLNLLSNVVMWILFTRALTAANSTTRVSILNTSANFMTTALLGFLLFSEGLPLGWWLGAALLGAGSFVSGAREGQEGQGGQEHRNGDTEGEGAVRLEGSERAIGADAAGPGVRRS